MGRDVPFNPEAICDCCGKTGAYNFMGDFSCEECAARAFADDRQSGDEENG